MKSCFTTYKLILVIFILFLCNPYRSRASFSNKESCEIKGFEPWLEQSFQHPNRKSFVSLLTLNYKDHLKALKKCVYMSKNYYLQQSSNIIVIDVGEIKPSQLHYYILQVLSQRIYDSEIDWTIFYIVNSDELNDFQLEEENMI